MRAFKRAVIFVHRWLGVALCLLFLLWFPSGIVMMYWDFPGVTPADRLQHAPALDPSRITLAPEQVARGAPRQVVLNTFDARPVYRFGGGRGSDSIVYADTGERVGAASKEMIDRAAASWSGRPVNAAQIESVTEVDQWTVGGALRTMRPLWKFSWPDGQQVYVSGASAEVVQYTTTASRIGAYFGAIPHWFYFTPLRKNQAQWSRVVIWTSGIGAVTALLGIVVGLWMYLPAARMPYVGQKRWHLILGLAFGIGAVTWAFSGMLSMDPFPLPRGPAPAPSLRGPIVMSAFRAKAPSAAVAEVGEPVKQLEFANVDGRAVYIASLAAGGTRIVPVDGPPIAAFDTDRLIALFTDAAQPRIFAETRLLTDYDRYYLDRHRQRPLPVLLAVADDADRTRYYIDPKTARTVASYSSQRWVSRYLYHGLHSLDVPWLYDHRPAWDLVVLTFMLGGTALCVTSVILAWRVVRPVRSVRSRGTGARADADI